MHCTQCDYPLWNLRARQCPECGQAFAPSEYEFVINSVRFCCPHCNQDYYGTGEKGHLVPPQFTCVSCGNMVHMDEMVLQPTEGVQEAQTVTDSIPWLDDRLTGISGTFSAFFGTFFRVLFDPVRVARLLPGEPRIGRAMSFAVACNAIAPLFSAAILLALFIFVGGGMAFGIALGMVVAWLAVFIIFLALWTVTTHGLLRLTGPMQGTIGRTFETLSYCTAPNIIAAIPCLGVYFAWIGWIWGSIVACLMLVQRQNVGGVRAAFAVLTFPIIVIVGGATLYGFWIAGVMRTVPVQMQQAQAQMTTAQANSVARGLLQYRSRTDEWPAHALQLVHHNDVQAHTLLVPIGGRTVRDVPVGGMSLENFTLLPLAREQEVTAAAARSLPADVIAHRLGDYVFTYHGVDPEADPGLWIAILVPPAPQARQAAPGARFGTLLPDVATISADGTVNTIPADQFEAVLAAQNTLRRSRGLSPLPDLEAISDGGWESPIGQ